MVGKKGQITAFIAVGILILLLTSVLFYVYSLQIPDRPDPVARTIFKKESVQTFLDICLRNNVPNAIYLLAQNGGYMYEYTPTLYTGSKDIAFHMQNGIDTSPPIDFMEQELARFTKEAMLICVNNFEDFQPSYIEAGNMNVFVSIQPGIVNVDVQYPVTIHQRDTVTQTNGAQLQIPVRLKHLLQIKNDIMSHSGDQTDLEGLSQYDVDVSVMPFDMDSFVYSITDFQSVLGNGGPLVFNFVIGKTGNSPPVLNYIPDVVAPSGEDFTYRATASDFDGDTLAFRAVGNGVSMDPSGFLLFYSTSPGVNDINVCVTDQKKEVCESFVITVENG